MFSFQNMYLFCQFKASDKKRRWVKNVWNIMQFIDRHANLKQIGENNHMYHIKLMLYSDLTWWW